MTWWVCMFLILYGIPLVLIAIMAPAVERKKHKLHAMGIYPLPYQLGPKPGTPLHDYIKKNWDAPHLADRSELRRIRHG